MVFGKKKVAKSPQHGQPIHAKIVKPQPIRHQLGEIVWVQYYIAGISIGHDGEPEYKLEPAPERYTSDSSSISYLSLYDAYRIINRKQSELIESESVREYTTIGNRPK